MKKIISVILALICIIAVFCGCKTEKPIPKYNTAVEGLTLDTASEQSVIENAITVDIYDAVKDSKVFTCAYEDIGVEKEDGYIIHYVAYSVGGYGKENGVLRRNKGIAPNTAVITLKKKGKNYMVMDFKSTYLIESNYEKERFLKENFEGKAEVFDGFPISMSEKLYYAEKQKLCDLGFAEKPEEIAGDGFEIELLPISEKAFTQIAEYFYEYPDWIGSEERIEDGKAITYVTEFKQTDDKGLVGTVSFVKQDENGKELSRVDIPVNGDEVTLPEPEPAESDPEFNYDDGIIYSNVD